jgi:MFS family permease
MSGLTISGLITPASLLGLGFVLGTTFAFAGPASMAIAANTVDLDDLPSAVALQSAANNLTRVVGPLLAAPLVAAGRYAIGFGAFAVAALVAGGLVSRMHLPPARRDNEESGLFERLRSGWLHARERPPVLAAIATAGSLALFGVAHIAMLPVYAEQALGARALFPWIVATTAFGAMLGALVTGRDPRPTLGRAALRLMLYGVALGVFASTERTAVALGAQLFVGYFYFSVMTGLQTLIQQIVDDARRGRVLSLFQLAWAGLTPIGSLAMGAAAGRLGIAPTLQGAAAACTLAGLYVSLRARR